MPSTKDSTATPSAYSASKLPFLLPLANRLGGSRRKAWRPAAADGIRSQVYLPAAYKPSQITPPGRTPIDACSVSVFLSSVDVSFKLIGHGSGVTCRWTSHRKTGTLLVTRRVSRRGNPPSPAVRACSSRAPTVSVSLTNHKRKASKHVQETHSRCDDCNSGVFGSHIPSRARSEAREVQQLQRVFRSHASPPARTNPSGKGSRGPISRENEARRPGCHQRSL